MIRTISLILLSLSTFNAMFAGQINENEFAKQFVEAFQGKYPDLSIKTVQGLHIQITKPDGKEYNAFLDNAFSEYSLDPQTLTSVIDRFSSALQENSMLESKVLDKDRIVPVIKDTAYLYEAMVALRERGINTDKLDQVYEKYNDSLVILYAEDTPHNMRFFSHEDLEHTGVTPSELRELSVKNLNKLLPKIELHGADGFYMMTAGGDYEASLLLFNSIWESDQIKVDGDYIITIPSRDVFFITGSNNKEGVEKLKEIAARAVSENSYHITKQLFVFKEGRFVEFKD